MTPELADKFRDLNDRMSRNSPKETDRRHPLLKRLGKFKVSDEFILSHPEIVMMLTGRCLVLRVERFDDFCVREYLAASEDFDEIGQFSAAPEYRAVLRKEGGAVLFDGFERIDTALSGCVQNSHCGVHLGISYGPDKAPRWKCQQCGYERLLVKGELNDRDR